MTQRSATLETIALPRGSTPLAAALEQFTEALPDDSNIAERKTRGFCARSVNPPARECDDHPLLLFLLRSSGSNPLALDLCLRHLPLH